MFSILGQSLDMYAPQEFKAGLRTEEEICKQIYDLDMPLKTKYSHILQRGQPNQKICVYRDLKRVFVEDQELFNHLLPIIKDNLANEREELLIEGGKSFIEILDSIKNSKQTWLNIKSVFLHIAIKLTQIFVHDVQETWNDVLINLMQCHTIEKTHIDELIEITEKLTDSSELTLCKENGIRLWAIMIEYGHMKFDNFSLERLRNITHEEDDFSIAKLLLYRLYPAILKHKKADKKEDENSISMNDVIFDLLMKNVYNEVFCIKESVLRILTEHQDIISKITLKKIYNLILFYGDSIENSPWVIGFLDKFVLNLIKPGNEDLKQEFLEKLISLIYKSASSFQNEVRASYLGVLANLKDHFSNIYDQPTLQTYFIEQDLDIRKALVSNITQLYDVADKDLYIKEFFDFCSIESNKEMVDLIGEKITPLFYKVYFDITIDDEYNKNEDSKKEIYKEALLKLKNNSGSQTILDAIKYCYSVLKTMQTFDKNFKNLCWRAYYKFFVFFKEVYVEFIIKKIFIQGIKDLIDYNNCEDCQFSEILSFMRVLNTELIDYLIKCLIESNYESCKQYAEQQMCLYSSLIYENQKIYLEKQIQEKLLKANTYQLRIRYLVLYEVSLNTLPNEQIKNLFFNQIQKFFDDKVEAVRVTLLKLIPKTHIFSFSQTDFNEIVQKLLQRFKDSLPKSSKYVKEIFDKIKAEVSEIKFNTPIIKTEYKKYQSRSHFDQQVVLARSELEKEHKCTTKDYCSIKNRTKSSTSCQLEMVDICILAGKNNRSQSDYQQKTDRSLPKKKVSPKPNKKNLLTKDKKNYSSFTYGNKASPSSTKNQLNSFLGDTEDKLKSRILLSEKAQSNVNNQNDILSNENSISNFDTLTVDNKNSEPYENCSKNQNDQIESDNTSLISFSSKATVKNKGKSLLPPRRQNSKQGERKNKNIRTPTILDIIHTNEIESKSSVIISNNENKEPQSKQNQFEKDMESILIKHKVNSEKHKKILKNDELDSLHETKSYDLAENYDNRIIQTMKEIESIDKELKQNSTYNEQPKQAYQINAEISAYNQQVEQKNSIQYDKIVKGRTKFNIGKTPTGVNFNNSGSTKNSSTIESSVENQQLKHQQAFNAPENNKQLKDFVKNNEFNSSFSNKNSENNTNDKDTSFKFNPSFNQKAKFLLKNTKKSCVSESESITNSDANRMKNLQVKKISDNIVLNINKFEPVSSTVVGSSKSIAHMNKPNGTRLNRNDLEFNEDLKIGFENKKSNNVTDNTNYNLYNPNDNIRIKNTKSANERFDNYSTKKATLKPMSNQDDKQIGLNELRNKMLNNNDQLNQNQDKRNVNLYKYNKTYNTGRNLNKFSVNEENQQNKDGKSYFTDGFRQDNLISNENNFSIGNNIRSESYDNNKIKRQIKNQVSNNKVTSIKEINTFAENSKKLKTTENSLVRDFNSLYKDKNTYKKSISENKARERMIKPLSCEQNQRTNYNIPGDYAAKRRKYIDKEKQKEFNGPETTTNAKFAHNLNYQNNILKKKNNDWEMNHEFEHISKNKDTLADYFNENSLNNKIISNALDMKNNHETTHSRINNKNQNVINKKKKKDFMLRVGTDNKPFMN